ncbi:hypothetical protein BCL57_002637 [Agromyces flavus]|uniref:SipW-cognate class signal peptide n=1 Tax=Agromyces flavus TaxID=589382 RepID=A0A1H1T9W6_9MICO|nr:hypothetical protein [Agromyces flavus]MCP2368464.1 hypothetical protein [Agromyces flavus]GGI47924.1 hypothetical protein GCM10010932_26120 [Agromyces flavus]SDS57037.1 hypothetical protein SAMN04489721_1537 [Agromyces flavus]
MSIRRTLAALAATAALVFAGAAGPALAGSPHFIKNATSAHLSGVDLVVDFKEAGLESGAVETVVASADLSATYSCVNGGNNVPSDPKKTTIDSRVSGSGEFTAGQNGNIVGSVTISPTPADQALDCPNGQDATLFSVVYTNVTIEDLDSGAFLAIRGTFSS